MRMVKVLKGVFVWGHNASTDNASTASIRRIDRGLDGRPVVCGPVTARTL